MPKAYRNRRRPYVPDFLSPPAQAAAVLLDAPPVCTPPRRPRPGSVYHPALPPSGSPWPGRDTFTDTAGTDLALHPADSGGIWTQHPAITGAAVITSANRLRSASTTSNGIYYHSAAPPSADYDVSADIHNFTNPATAETVGVVGRLSTATLDYYVGRYRSTVGFQILKSVGGASTQLGSSFARTLAAGEEARITLRMAGTSISLLVDGVVRVGPITDAAVTAAGFAGVYLISSATADTDATGSHLDNYQTSSAYNLGYPARQTARLRSPARGQVLTSRLGPAAAVQIALLRPSVSPPRFRLRSGLVVRLRLMVPTPVLRTPLRRLPVLSSGRKRPGLVILPRLGKASAAAKLFRRELLFRTGSRGPF